MRSNNMQPADPGLRGIRTTAWASMAPEPGRGLHDYPYQTSLTRAKATDSNLIAPSRARTPKAAHCAGWGGAKQAMPARARWWRRCCGATSSNLHQRRDYAVAAACRRATLLRCANRSVFIRTTTGFRCAFVSQYYGFGVCLFLRPWSRVGLTTHRHVRRPCSRPLQEQVPQGDLRPITCIPWVDWQLEESLRVGPHGCERCQGRPTTRQGPSSGDLRQGARVRPRTRARRRRNASVLVLKRPPTSRPKTTRRHRPRPLQLQFRVRALLTPGSLFQREPWPRVCAGPRLPVASDRADQRGVHRNLRPLPQRQAVGHHLDPPAIRRRRVEVEVPKGDAGGHPCSGLTANARRSPFKGPRSLREHPDLSTRRSVTTVLVLLRKTMS